VSVTTTSSLSGIRRKEADILAGPIQRAKSDEEISTDSTVSFMTAASQLFVTVPDGGCSR